MLKSTYVFLPYAVLAVLLIGLAYVPSYSAAGTGPSLHSSGYYYYYYFGGIAATNTNTIRCHEVTVMFVLPQGGTITAEDKIHASGDSATYCIGQRVNIIAVPPSGYRWWRWDTGGAVSVDSNASSDTYMTVGGPGGLKASFVPVA